MMAKLLAHAGLTHQDSVQRGRQVWSIQEFVVVGEFVGSGS